MMRNNLTKRQEEIKFNIKMTICVLYTCSFICSIVFAGILAIQFDRKYLSHLKRAADANSLELAEKELSSAMTWIKDNKLDSTETLNRAFHPDHTDILWTTPKNQVSFHVDNIRASLNEVRSIMNNKNTTSLEKSNVLMKLRETLLDTSTNGVVEVTHPEHLHLFPFNAQFSIFQILLMCGILYELFPWYYRKHLK